MARIWLPPFDPAADYVATRQVRLRADLTLEAGQDFPRGEATTRLMRQLYEQRRIDYKVAPPVIRGWGSLKRVVPAGTFAGSAKPVTAAPRASNPQAKINTPAKKKPKKKKRKASAKAKPERETPAAA